MTLSGDHSQKSTDILGLSVCSVRSQAAAQQQPTRGEECREQTAQVTILILMRRFTTLLRVSVRRERTGQEIIAMVIVLS